MVGKQDVRLYEERRASLSGSVDVIIGQQLRGD